VIGCWCALTATKIHAQRVQFPSTVAQAPAASPFAAAPPPIYPTTPQPSLAPALPGFDPYATPGLAAPPPNVPYTPPTLTPNFATPSPFGTTPAGAPPLTGIPYAPPPNTNIL
jgi:hypothetical protein